MSANEHLSPEQFSNLYPPGQIHNVKLEHLSGLGDTAGRDPRIVHSIATSMKSEGYKGDPMHVWVGKSTLDMDDGHHRRLAAFQAGLSHVPVHVEQMD